MGTEHSGVTDKPQTVFAGRLEAFTPAQRNLQ